MTSKAKSLLKYLLALLLLIFILRTAGVEKIMGYLKQISLGHFLLAFFCATIAQIISALRMRYFFAASGFPLGARFAVILGYVGAFYNFLLPGGIGGDAYKVILARKRMEMPAMQGIRIMVADRASGLCVVMLVLFYTLWNVDFSAHIPYAKPLLLAAAAITLTTYVGLCQRLLRQMPRTMLWSLPYSLVAQLLWIATLAIIWSSIGNGQHLSEYIMFYSAASITGLLPVSVGGLGIKEMTYFYGAALLLRFAGMPVDADLGVALSLCMFAMAFFTALPGLLWLGKVEHARI